MTLSMLRISPVHRQGSWPRSLGTAYQYKANVAQQASLGTFEGPLALRTSLDVGVDLGSTPLNAEHFQFS